MLIDRYNVTWYIIITVQSTHLLHCMYVILVGKYSQEWFITLWCVIMIMVECGSRVLDKWVCAMKRYTNYIKGQCMFRGNRYYFDCSKVTNHWVFSTTWPLEICYYVVKSQINQDEFHASAGSEPAPSLYQASILTTTPRQVW